MCHGQGLEAVVHVRGRQRAVSTGEVGKPDRRVEEAGEQPLQASPVAAARRLLVLHVEHLPLDGLDNDSAAIQIRPQQGDVIGEGGRHQAKGFSPACHIFVADCSSASHTLPAPNGVSINSRPQSTTEAGGRRRIPASAGPHKDDVMKLSLRGLTAIVAAAVMASAAAATAQTKRLAHQRSLLLHRRHQDTASRRLPHLASARPY